MQLLGFDPRKPTATYLASLSMWNCKINGEPIRILVNWDKHEVRLTSPLFPKKHISMEEYDNADGMNFEQWITHKIKEILDARNSPL